MASNKHLNLFIYTGNRKNAGTNSSAHIILYGDNGQASKPIALNLVFSNEFEREQIDTFRLSADDVDDLGRFVNVERIELWKDKTLRIFSDDWYVDKIVVQNTATNDNFEFPLFRWIKHGYHYNFKRLDTSLPQFDEFPEQRKKELDEKKKTYRLEQKREKGLCQVHQLPPDEQFSFDYKWGIVTGGLYLKVVGAWTGFNRKKWTCVADIEKIYDEGLYERPSCVDRWDSDIEFARQRLAGVNPSMISLLRSVPEKFPITDELLGPLLEGLSIEKAISKKRLFLCDLKVLDGIPHKTDITLCSPFALFFVDKEKQLRPIAIQLFQEPGPENPIFTPLDDPMLWKYVKLWYNNADANVHQSITHLGMTHLLMEGIAVSANRHLSPSHPILKILSPHFLYLIAINWRGLKVLIAKGGWVDQVMSMGRDGMLALMRNSFSEWRMDLNGLLPEELKARGLDDPDVLPGYHYRDDAMMLFNAIGKYVTSYVDLYYTSQDLIKGDLELQAWAQEMVLERQKLDGGVGVKGVPGNGSVNSTHELIDIVTCIIFTCSCAHAACNFGQYDEYGYPLHYPTLLKGKPPSSKDAQITEEEIFHSVSDPNIMINILEISTVLSRKATFSLGDYEVQYIFDPKARALIDTFREDLKGITEKIIARNTKLDLPYDYLLPDRIPNSIGI